MALIEWEEKFSVGIKELDNHHQKLVSMINELHEAMRVGKGKEIMDELVAKLIDYTKFHFQAEEKYMQKYNFPGYLHHKSEHEQFTKKVSDFQQSLNSGKTIVSMDVMSFLKNWLLNHITGTDKKYGPFLNEKGLL